VYPFWEVIVEPTLKRLRPRVVVEVGSEAANSTVRLAAFCREQGALLHSIDPAPKFDVERFSQEYEGYFQFHRAKSLEALPRIPTYDVVLIDGDHNWYTVFHELKLLEERALKQSPPFPMVFLHDVGWPYARRDLYYDPTSIPPEFRQPYARKGMHPDQSRLLDSGGMNPNLCNALEEGTPRNGVLTAVEDFLAQTSIPLDFWIIPGLNGLGILAPRAVLEQNASLADYLDQWRLPDDVTAYLERIEDFRIRNILRLLDTRAALAREQARLGARIRELEGVVQQMTAKLHAAQGELSRLKASS